VAVNDLVVVLPGIMGSTLAKDGRLVWAPSAGALLRALSSFGDSVLSLALPSGIGDDHPGDGVTAEGLLADLHAIPGVWTPVKGYNVLVEHLRRTTQNVLPVAYDWRLSSRYNGRRLANIVEPALDRLRAKGGPYREAKVVFVCHSMGGLVASWYIEREGGSEITRKLITLGTPYRGAAKALVQLVEGVPGKIGRLAPDLTTFVRSLPSIHQLMPEYACITSGRDLLRTNEVSLPDLSTTMVADAMTFHNQLKDAHKLSADGVHAIVGIKQPTSTTATLSDGKVVALDTYGPDNLYGDGTVPLTGAARAGTSLDSPVLRRIADKHGNLQRNRAALDEIDGVLTGTDIMVKAPEFVHPQVTVPELLLVGEELAVEISLPGQHAITVIVRDEHGQPVDVLKPRVSHGQAVAIFDGLRPGGYTVDVAGGSAVAPVSSDILVWDKEL
jgi:pimeloyl-ACP methyl ester carboxylesterase